jgi:transcription elongation factor Elf1
MKKCLYCGKEAKWELTRIDTEWKGKEKKIMVCGSCFKEFKKRVKKVKVKVGKVIFILARGM